jgi:very-long-chain ceramide synthase
MSERRGSIIGPIPVGDTGASLSTMPVAASRAQASRRRKRALSGTRSMIGPDGTLKIVPAKEPKAGGIRRMWLSFLELSHENTWLTPLLLLIGFYLAFFLSSDKSASNPLHQFICLSYEIPGTDPVIYGKGLRDLSFVGFHMIFFTFVREFSMQVILRPTARKLGLAKKGKINRFMEQTYSMMYYGFSGPVGLYIMSTMPIWYFNTTHFYLSYPHKTHEWMLKRFYLMQASFWAQQSLVLILQLEKPRKDFVELVFHHVVTMALILLSYRFHFTWMGVAVYFTMDVSDFFLASSKTLNYLDSELTGPFFVTFIGVWVYMRHYLNLKILYSILTEFATAGPFELDWATEQYKCWISQAITFALLLALQAVNVYWLVLIIRVGIRYVFTNVTKDDRSDDEDEDDDGDVVDSPIEGEMKKQK